VTRPVALTQFIALIGGDLIAKGSVYEEPLRGPQPSVAFIIGQSDYIAGKLRSPLGEIACPFVLGTYDAEQWGAGKFRERQHERAANNAYVGRNQRSD
jgi:hypothetical protein